MDYHKDKFVSPIIYRELEGLVMTKDGRIDHSPNTHDDQVFSYLLALYVWYDGHNTKENWGLTKQELYTDEELNEVINEIGENEYNIMKELGFAEDEVVQSQIAQLDKSMLYEEWAYKQKQQDDMFTQQLIRSNPRALRAYAKANAMDVEDLQRQTSNGQFIVPANVYSAEADLDESNTLQFFR